MSINEKQKILIIIGTVIAILMCLFPPWKYILHGGPNDMYSGTFAGYSFLFHPPMNGYHYDGVELNIKRLSVQLLIILLTTALGVFIVATTKKK
jgi:hypothetical protein